jgi:hypothetical protein
VIADTLANTIAAWFLFAALAFLVFAVFVVAHEKIQGFSNSWRSRGSEYRRTRQVERHNGHRHGL